MTTAELITRMAQEASLTRPHAAQVLAAFLGQTQAALRRGWRRAVHTGEQRRCWREPGSCQW